MYEKSTLVALLICGYLATYAQLDPVFTNFKGNVYSIPYKLVKSGYGPHIYDYDSIGTIDWKEINVSDRDNSEPFPDVDKSSLFGMVLHSEVTIPDDACYEFMLNSDDGSLLWINKKLIVNNAGDHGMKEVRDTVQIKKGTYPVKIWYHQAYPDRYGFIFNYNYFGPMTTCKKNLKRTSEEIITINASLLFDYNSFVVEEKAVKEISLISEKIWQMQPSVITIKGYTDDRGDEAYNLKLSQKRADAIMQLLMKKLNPGISYISKGMGEAEPIADNDTDEGREKNRRVELVIK